MCVLVVPGYKPVIGRGEVLGRIADQSTGAKGFGYDPIFWYEPYKKTFGQVDAQLKDAVSHRGQAIRALQAKLAQIVR